MQRYLFPSLTKVMLTFVLLGPCLWPIAVLLVGLLTLQVAIGIPDPVAVLLGLPMISGAGAALWWWVSFKTNNWLGTLVPTILASVTYWLVMTRLSENTLLKYRTKRHWIAANIFVCALVSVASFCVVVGISATFGLEAQPLPVNQQSQTNSWSWVAIANWVAVVGIIGAMLGAVVSVFSKKEMFQGDCLIPIFESVDV